MVLACLSLGFAFDDLYWLTPNEIAIFAAINAENYESATSKKKRTVYRDARGQADIEKLKRM